MVRGQGPKLGAAFIHLSESTNGPYGIHWGTQPTHLQLVEERSHPQSNRLSSTICQAGSGPSHVWQLMLYGRDTTSYHC